MLERLAPPASGITGAFDSAYFSGLKTVSSFIPSTWKVFYLPALDR